MRLQHLLHLVSCQLIFNVSKLNELSAYEPRGFTQDIKSQDLRDVGEFGSAVEFGKRSFVDSHSLGTNSKPKRQAVDVIIIDEGEVVDADFRT